MEKNDGDFPAETLCELFVSLQLYIYLNGQSVKLLADNDFEELLNCLDWMKELSRVGKVYPRAAIISLEQGNDMSKRNILGSDTPKQLVNNISYMFGVLFALHVGVSIDHCMWYLLLKLVYMKRML